MKSNFKAMVSLFVVGGLLLATGGFVYADSADTDTKSKYNKFEQNMPHGKGEPRHGNISKDGLSLSNMQRGGQTGGFDNYTDLVTAGIITQDIADKMSEYLTERASTHKAEIDAEREKVQNMTADERKAYFESKKGTRPTDKPCLFKELVDDGTLTQEQADAVSKNLHPKKSQS